MTASVAQIVALTLGVASAALWATVATSSRPVRSPAWWAPAVGAMVAVAGGIAATAALWTHHWSFAADRVVLAAPLALGGAVWFAISGIADLRVDARRRASASTRLSAWTGVVAAAMGLLGAFVIGAPFSGWTAAAAWALSLGAIAIIALVVVRPASRRPFAVVSAGVAGVLVVSVAFTALGAAGPDPIHTAAHGHEAVTGDDAVQGFPGTDPVSVTQLREERTGAADVRVELDARAGTYELPSGDSVTAWTFGELGGRLIEATQGDLVEVVLNNRDIAEGVTLHWHGYAVPNGDDGVAGVTQDAVAPGDSFTSRFVADQPGTYWYHTHQAASTGVVKGLYGMFVVHPDDGAAPPDLDLAVPLHTFAGRLVMGANDEVATHVVAPGAEVRVRLANTDQVTRAVAVSGTAFRVLAIDGSEIADPGDLDAESVSIPAGGRVDIGFRMPSTGARIDDTGSRSARLSFLTADGAAEPARVAPTASFDPLRYGSAPLPDWADGPFDVDRTVVLDRLPRFTANGPAYAYTIDGAVFPQIEPTVVREGDIVALTIVNRGYETHPMHPHGHRALVLEVDGKAPEGALWVDSFDVGPGQVWRIALVADNPGIWMDHCHNLEHAALGMVSHLAYEGVVSPFDHGGDTGNSPE